MPTYSSLLRFVEPTDGDPNWGGTVNAGFTELADASIAGTATVDVTASDVTLSVANGGDDQARKMVLSITGSPGAARNVIVPSTSKIYFVTNSCGQTATVKVSGQTGVAVPTGASMVLRVNGTDAVQAVDRFNSLVLGTPLPVSSGGTGAATLTGIVKGSGTSAFSAAVAGTDYVSPAGSETLTNKTIEAGTFTNGYTEEVATANTGASYSIDLTNGSIQILTLTASCTFTFPTATAGKSFMLFLKQDGTGSRTATWPGSVLWPSATAPILTTAANKTDRFVFTADGTYWYGSNAGQNY